jgi:ATP-dependent Clp protease ATP-binding subunit ClpB
MNPERFTVKLQEALNAAQSIATKHGHQELKSAHLLLALLEQEGGLAPQLFERAAGRPGAAQGVVAAVQQWLGRVPKVSGAAAGQLYLAGEFRELMSRAEEEQKKLKDEYLSVEHVILALAEGNGEMGGVLKEAGVTPAALREALTAVRGSQRVVDQDPEGKYQTLEKYGTDLTARARAGKLDPVIGRDDEIRRAIQVLQSAHQEQPGA